MHTLSKRLPFLHFLLDSTQPKKLAFREKKSLNGLGEGGGGLSSTQPQPNLPKLFKTMPFRVSYLKSVWVCQDHPIHKIKYLILNILFIHTQITYSNFTFKLSIAWIACGSKVAL